MLSKYQKTVYLNNRLRNIKMPASASKKKSDNMSSKDLLIEKNHLTFFLSYCTLQKCKKGFSCLLCHSIKPMTSS